MSSVSRTYDTYLDFHILNTFPSSASGSSIYAQAIFKYVSELSPKTSSKSDWHTPWLKSGDSLEEVYCHAILFFMVVSITSTQSLFKSFCLLKVPFCLAEV